MSKKIYLSSTFRDLAEYREQAMDTLEYLSTYFTLVTPMEKMLPGSGQPPLADCLALVGSCDIYVLILGKLYGSRPAGDPISFTHHEYEEARRLKKIIIPLIADPKASGLKPIQTDDAAALSGFINDVRTAFTTYNQGFKSADKMCTQLIMALMRYAQASWDFEPLKIRCDREHQSQTMIIKRRREELNVFSMKSTRQDLPDSFLKRMALYEFSCRREFLTNPLHTGTIINLEGDLRTTQLLFAAHILKPFLDPLQEDEPAGIGESLERLIGKGVTRLFQHFRLSVNDLRNPRIAELLKSIMLELEAACNEKKFTFFLVFNFVTPASAPVTQAQAAEENQLIQLLASANTPVIALSPLGKVNQFDMEDWLRNYVTGDELSVLQLTEMIYPDDTEYYMSELFSKLADKEIAAELERLINT